jgi:hypothetical protein
LLSNREITLLDPKTWDDENDSYFMSLYKERNSLRTVLALCFSQAAETYHHWRVFSNGPAGACIVFDKKALMAVLQKQRGVQMGAVTYLTLKTAKTKKFKVQQLPFLKRVGFKPEEEVRAVYSSDNIELPALGVPIRLSCIRSISLSPWMNRSLSKSTVAAIRAIKGCGDLKVSRSTLISNDQWKEFGRSAT